MRSSLSFLGVAAAALILATCKADFTLYTVYDANYYCSGDTGHCSNDPTFDDYMPASTSGPGEICPSNETPDSGSITSTGVQNSTGNLGWSTGFCGNTDPIECNAYSGEDVWVCSDLTTGDSWTCPDASETVSLQCAVPNVDTESDEFIAQFTCITSVVSC